MRTTGLLLLLGAFGAVTGAGIAGREVARQGYLAADLWRTSLWVASHGARLGLAAGAASALLLLLLLSGWSAALAAKQERRQSGPTGERFRLLQPPAWAGRTVVFLGGLSAIGALALPDRLSVGFGPPYLVMAALALALVWLPATAFAAAAGGRGDPNRAFRFRWCTVLAFIWLVAVFHMWARSDGWLGLVQLAFCGLVVCAVAYFWLDRVARPIHDRIGRAVGSAMTGRPGRAVAAAALLGVVGLWSGSHAVKRGARAEAAERGYNVILIGLDTVRKDRTSLLSGTQDNRDLTPNLRELVADRGTVFTGAISQAPWTLPAFASVFTGIYPEEHGAGFRGDTLRREQVTLAEILGESGYRTCGVVSGVYVNRRAGMHQGFEWFDDSQAEGQKTVTSAEVTDRTLEFLRAHRDEPFFVFAHYFDPHWVYRDHETYDFADWYAGALREPSQNLKQHEFGQLLSNARQGTAQPILDREELTYLRDLYDEEIAFTDAEVGRLLRYVRDAGLEESTLVIVVADHGEEFLEHEHLGHQRFSLYHELIHVSLAVAHPGDSDRRVVDRPVETRSIFSTVLDFLDVVPPAGRAYPPSLMDDASQINAFTRSSSRASMNVRGGFVGGGARNVWLTSIADSRWKIIKVHLNDEVMLFDLDSDPGETRDCSAECLEERSRLAQELDRLDGLLSRRASKQPTPDVHEEQKRKLKALGYL